MERMLLCECDYRAAQLLTSSIVLRSVRDHALFPLCSSFSTGTSLNIQGLRTFRVLRPLRTITHLSGW